MGSESREWLQRIHATWVARLRTARAVKKQVFGKTAGVLWDFLTRSYRELYIAGPSRTALREAGLLAESENGFPLYQPRLNKCQEYVDLYLPMLFGGVPKRTVTPTRPQFPSQIYDVAVPVVIQDAIAALPMKAVDTMIRVALETAAVLQEWWLNYLIGRYDFDREVRLALTEALVKGRGLLWHSLMESGDHATPVALFESVDNLLIDPSATVMRDAGWIAIRRAQPAWMAAQRLNMREEELLELAGKQLMASRSRRGTTLDDSDEDTAPIDSDALVSGTPLGAGENAPGVRMVTYYEVWSRIGLGHVMLGDTEASIDPALRDTLDSLGPYVWLVIAENADAPLNMRFMRDESQPSEVVEAISWPIKTYGRALDPWPATIIDFKPNTDNAWAKSPLEPGLPLQVFLDQLYAYVMSRVRLSARSILLTPTDISPELRAALRSDNDMELVSVSVEMLQRFSANSLVQVLNIPPITGDVWQVFSIIEREFHKAVGLDPSLYGSQVSAETRSAAAAHLRHQSSTGRAQAMAAQVVRWMDSVAAKDAILSRMYVPPSAMARHFSEQYDEQLGVVGPLAGLWKAKVYTDDPIAAAEEYEYRIEAASIQPPDTELRRESAMQLLQVLLPVAMKAAAETRDYSLYNSLTYKLAAALGVDWSLFRIDMPDAFSAGPQGGAPPGQATQPEPGARPGAPAEPAPPGEMPAGPPQGA